MSSAIPFLRTKFESENVGEFHAEAQLFRVTPETPASGFLSSVGKSRVWLDPGFDGIHRHSEEQATAASKKPDLSVKEGRKWDSEWARRMTSAGDWTKFTSAEFLARPDKGFVTEFVSRLLSSAAGYAWCTVPQLPVCEDSSANKTNRYLASAARQWSESYGRGVKLVLPIIWMKQNQYLTKSRSSSTGGRGWGTVVTAAEKCFKLSGAAGYWSVDATLADQAGTGTFRKRLPALVEAYQALSERLQPSELSVAGPYWGLNLALWGRGIVTAPAVGVGGGYRYHLSGGLAFNTPKARVACPFLRRWVPATPGLLDWIERVTKEVNPVEAGQLLTFQRDVERSIAKSPQGSGAAKSSLARFYSGWVRKLDSVDRAGRATLLFQQFASAYALGKSMPQLPREGKGGEDPVKPSIVAQQMMLISL